MKLLGLYKDRKLPLVRVYPCPFTRVTVTWGFRNWAAEQVRKGRRETR